MGAIKMLKGGRFAQSEGASLPQFEAKAGDCLLVGPITEKSLIDAEAAKACTEKEAKSAVTPDVAKSVGLEAAVTAPAPPDKDKRQAETKAPAATSGGDGSS